MARKKVVVGFDAVEFFKNLTESAKDWDTELDAIFQFTIDDKHWYIHPIEKKVVEGISNVQSFVMACDNETFGEFVTGSIDLLHALKTGRMKIHGHCVGFIKVIELICG